jgi:hypothetical protein
MRHDGADFAEKPAAFVSVAQLFARTLACNREQSFEGNDLLAGF